MVDLKSSTPEKDRLRNDILESTDKLALEDEAVSDCPSNEDEDEASTDFIDHFGPPGKRRKVELKEERVRRDIWNRRFKDPLRLANVEPFKTKVNSYLEGGATLDKAVHHAANDDLPYLRKRLRKEYAQFLIDFYELQHDPIQQQVLDSATTFRLQHDMSQAESIRQGIKLRKNLFDDVWPDHTIEEEALKQDEDTERSEEE